ncbi:uncharacterized protein LOC131847510 [Achroia grisella]|uniref:uncharacterized protein LOC131847510 n=1 Tax=Achroia grisella TaxID=688607 RepID=UPI0027D3270D|nr:uncharacterized protein LOC131847510 [Achroia grisella]
MGPYILVVILTIHSASVSGLEENATKSEFPDKSLETIIHPDSALTLGESKSRTRFEEDTVTQIKPRRQYGLIKFEQQSGQKFKFDDEFQEQSGQKFKFDDEFQELSGQKFKFDDDFQEQSGQKFKFDDEFEDDLGQKLNFNDKFNKQSSQKFKFGDDTNNKPFTVDDNNLQGPKFQGDSGIYNQIGNGYQQDNKIENQKPTKKKKRRRRRRKPRYQFGGYPGIQSPAGLPQGLPGQAGQYPINPGLLAQPQGQVPYPYPNAVGPGQFYRPPRRPQPSAASQALSTITGALSSIALYDDYQCVPRLLCEAAGGGTLGSGVLQSVGGLQPLLTLLAAYNGISTSPLFVFGRAVLLGMTSKGNTGTCRYAYSQCPTDPEQLVHYLNNHNGGFFRFFNAPQVPNPQVGQQNVEQFYNQLSVPQNYGLYTPNLNSAQNYGLYQPVVNPGYADQNYGLYQPSHIPPYQGRYKDEIFDDNETPKWLFPDNNKVNINMNYVRDGKALKFPDEDTNVKHDNENDYNTDDRKGKGFNFPDQLTNVKYVDYNAFPPINHINNNNANYQNTHVLSDPNYYNVNTPAISNNVYNREIHYNAVSAANNYNTNFNDNNVVETVYIVRGNGDPNHPEIVKVKPGQSIQ